MLRTFLVKVTFLSQDHIGVVGGILLLEVLSRIHITFKFRIQGCHVSPAIIVDLGPVFVYADTFPGLQVVVEIGPVWNIEVKVLQLVERHDSLQDILGITFSLGLLLSLLGKVRFRILFLEGFELFLLDESSDSSFQLVFQVVLHFGSYVHCALVVVIDVNFEGLLHFWDDGEPWQLLRPNVLDVRYLISWVDVVLLCLIDLH